MEKDGIGAQVEGGGGSGHLIEKDGIGAQVEEKRRIRGT